MFIHQCIPTVLVDATITLARRFIPDGNCDSINCVTHREGSGQAEFAWD